MPRFVVLQHDHPVLHWDFMLEVGEVLRTWRLAAPPAAGQVIAADVLGDHRKRYLDYEGPVSRNRGAVVRWDQGEYELRVEAEDEMIIAVAGEKLRGACHLMRSGARWQFHFEPAVTESGS